MMFDISELGWSSFSQVDMLKLVYANICTMSVDAKRNIMYAAFSGNSVNLFRRNATSDRTGYIYAYLTASITGIHVETGGKAWFFVQCYIHDRN